MISVIVCTFNRAESLRRTLQSLAGMTDHTRLHWEVIVVDNNSTDDTKTVVMHFANSSGLQVRYCFESHQGLSHARNKGVREAKGEILAFIDDDVMVTRDWLPQINKAFTEYEATCVGGKVLLREDLRTPDWWHEDYNGSLGAFNKGDSVLCGRRGFDGTIGIGANLSFKRSTFDKYGLFDTDLGRIGKKLVMGEEIEFYRRLTDNGELIVYYPDATVYSCPEVERISKQYLRRWHFRIGEWFFLEEMLSKKETKKLFGLTRWRWRRALENIYAYFRHTLAFRRREVFYNELHLVVFVGYLFCSLKMKYIRTRALLASKYGEARLHISSHR